MVNRPKAIGTAAESAVVKAARRLGFPMAERMVLHGSLDQGDVRLTPGLTAGVVVEVKGGAAARTASDGLIHEWLIETETERINAGADVALLVTQRPGFAAQRAQHWWAHWRVGDLARLHGWHDPYGRDHELAADAPIRMSLASALAQLRAAGYGEPLEVDHAERAAA